MLRNRKALTLVFKKVSEKGAPARACEEAREHSRALPLNLARGRPVGAHLSVLLFEEQRRAPMQKEHEQRQQAEALPEIPVASPCR